MHAGLHVSVATSLAGTMQSIANSNHVHRRCHFLDPLEEPEMRRTAPSRLVLIARVLF